MLADPRAPCRRAPRRRLGVVAGAEGGWDELVAMSKGPKLRRDGSDGAGRTRRGVRLRELETQLGHLGDGLRVGGGVLGECRDQQRLAVRDSNPQPSDPYMLASQMREFCR